MIFELLERIKNTDISVNKEKKHIYRLFKVNNRYKNFINIYLHYSSVRKEKTKIDFKISTEIRNWAKRWVDKDIEYIQQRARFAPEPVKSIARTVLMIADGGSK